MKIFSLLLLQCKKQSCRMKSYLIPNACSIEEARIQIPKKNDLNFLEAQMDTISSMDMSTNQFILPIILYEIKRTSVIKGRPDSLLNIPDQDIQSILESGSKILQLSEDKINSLFNILFSFEIVNGVLYCSLCNEKYVINNKIINFMQTDTNDK